MAPSPSSETIRKPPTCAPIGISIRIGPNSVTLSTEDLNPRPKRDSSEDALLAREGITHSEAAWCDLVRPPSPGGATVIAKKPPVCTDSSSPLTDSNRRPPPYHAIQTATGGSRWQRFVASSSRFRASGHPNLCHPLRPLCSITVPSQSAQNGHFGAGPASPEARLTPSV